MRSPVPSRWVLLTVFALVIGAVSWGAVRTSNRPGIVPDVAKEVAPPGTVGAHPAEPGSGSQTTAVAESSQTIALPPKSAIGCSDIQTGIELEYFARHLLPGGQLDSAWTSAGNYLCLGSSDDLNGVTCRDGSGGVFVGWVDSRRGDPDIYLQHFDASGVVRPNWPAGGLPICRAALSQYNLDVAPDGSGGVYLAWQDFRDPHAGDIYAQHVTGSGELASGWSDGGRAVCSEPHAQAFPQIAADFQGGLWLVWQDWRGPRLGLFAQHLDANGTPKSGWPANGGAITSGNGADEAPAVASDSSGTLLVSYRVRREAAFDLGIVALGFGDVPGSGWVPQPSVLASGADRVGDPAVATASPGRALVAWTETRNGSDRLVLQAISEAGHLATGWPSSGLTLSTSTLGVSAPRILRTADSAYVVAWEDFRSGTSDIYAQCVSAAGSIPNGWPENGLAVESGAGEQYAPALASDGAGGALVTWSDAANSSRASFAGAQWALASEVMLAHATASPGRVSIVWSAPRSLTGIEAQRRLPGVVEWSKLGALTPNDSGFVVLSDRAAPDGASVAYRLAITGSDYVRYLEPVVLEIPTAPLRLALHRAWAIPTQNVIALSLALPRGAPPTVDLYDVMGRRMQRRVLTGLDPGEQTVRVGVPRQLASGVYFVRLTQGSEARSAKVVFIR